MASLSLDKNVKRQIASADGTVDMLRRAADSAAEMIAKAKLMGAQKPTAYVSRVSRDEVSITVEGEY